MAKITLNLPESLKGVRFTKEERRRMELGILPDAAEKLAIKLAEKKFGQKFYPMPYNFKGWDIISKDGLIKIEVKQTSCLGTKTCLSIGAIWSKKDYCTHVMIIDFYNTTLSVSCIENNLFFSSNFHGKTKKWRWNKDYNRNNQPINTVLFMDNKINLN